MRANFAPLVIALIMALSACAKAPEIKPVVSDRQVTPREISPGESIMVSFRLGTEDPAVVERIYIRGLPENTLAAGTQTDLPLPNGPFIDYAYPVELRVPAMDGQYNLELVLETSGKTYFAPLGTLAIRDTPSRILYTQFLPGSHAADDCSLGTKLLEFQYAVADDNGAADFVGATLVAKDTESKNLVFFPHWEPVANLGGKPGIFLTPPAQNDVKQELVTSDIRIHCKVPEASLYEYVVHGQSVSRLTGQSTEIGGGPARYYVE
jgi:hypothetical protein